VSKPFEVAVEAVYVLQGRGLTIAGTHKGGEIRTGDQAQLVGEKGTEPVPVPEVRVEVHKPLGRLAVVLLGVDREQVKVGQKLRPPPRRKAKAETPAQNPAPS
jgi:translation elongation factor EF-Tu-like GTPase